MSSGESQIPLIVILGPTASGKTALSVRLAQELDGEIISADALAVYNEMQIGTAAPTVEEQAGIPHHCLACIDPSENCDAQRWFSMADAALKDIHARGKTVIIAGGTPMYVKLLLEGISAGPPKDEVIRAQLDEEYRERGGEAMLEELQRVDPDYASERHANDARRIVRALEVYRISGKPYSSFHTTDGNRRADLRTLLMGLRWEKEVLHKRINKRCKLMFENGLADEVAALDGRISKTALAGVGYKEVFPLVKGKIKLADAIYKVSKGTRLLAKHQMTWYRRFRDIEWFDGDAEDLSDQCLSRAQYFLSNS